MLEIFWINLVVFIFLVFYDFFYSLVSLFSSLDLAKECDVMSYVTVTNFTYMLLSISYSYVTW